MDSSSENSFAWTDTSSDSFNSTSMAADNNNEKSEENCDSHNEKKKKEKMSAKRKIRNDESADRNYNREQSYYSETQSDNVKKMIKLEPESDFEVPKKKKKIKYHETNGNSNESTSYDETYLNMKVKQEDCVESSSKKHKQKKLKRHTSTDSTKLTSREDYQNECSGENITLNQESELELNHSKKKSKKRHDSMEPNEDKMDIEETVVNKQETLVTGNNTLYEESEDSGCNEISAIKCDDEHNIHTISIIKSLEDNCLNDTTHSQCKLNNASEHKSKQKLKATLHKTQSISDRILFEDDITENKVNILCENDYGNSKKSAKLQRFVRANPDLKQLSQKLDNDSNLTLDDEIWILQCPKEIDIKDFNDTSLNIHGKCKIKVAGKTYDGSAEEKQSDTVPLLTMEHNKYKIKNLHLNGIINLRKRIPKAHFHEDNIMVNNQTNFIPLPDTKCRHPLFGSNYKKALKIPTAIAERLNVEVGQESLMKTKRKKKNKETNDKNMSKQANSQELHLKLKSESNLSDEKSDKKKKKRKIVDDNSPPKKVKRIKYDPESAEAWESEKAIEENLFNF